MANVPDLVSDHRLELTSRKRIADPARDGDGRIAASEAGGKRVQLRSGDLVDVRRRREAGAFGDPRAERGEALVSSACIRGLAMRHVALRLGMRHHSIAVALQYRFAHLAARTYGGTAARCRLDGA